VTIPGILTYRSNLTIVVGIGIVILTVMTIYWYLMWLLLLKLLRLVTPIDIVLTIVLMTMTINKLTNIGPVMVAIFRIYRLLTLLTLCSAVVAWPVITVIVDRPICLIPCGSIDTRPAFDVTDITLFVDITDLLLLFSVVRAFHFLTLHYSIDQYSYHWLLTIDLYSILLEQTSDDVVLWCDVTWLLMMTSYL